MRILTIDLLVFLFIYVDKQSNRKVVQKMDASDESMEGLGGETDNEESTSIYYTLSEFFDSGIEDTLEFFLSLYIQTSSKLQKYSPPSPFSFTL